MSYTRTSDLAGIPASLRDHLERFLFAVGDGAPPTLYGAGAAPIGSLYLNRTGAVWYKNTGTVAAPTWAAIVTITAAELAVGAMTADATGRAIFAADFFNEATLLAKVLTGAATTAALTDMIPNDAFTDVFLLAKVLSGAFTSAFLTDAIPDDAVTAAIANDIIQNGAIGSALLTNPQCYDAGCPMRQVLVASGNVVDNETVTIGADVYEFIVVNTDSTDDTQGANFNNVTNPLPLTAWDTNYPACTGLIVGDLIRVENEIMRVSARAAGAETITFTRGHSGTTIATHANGTHVYLPHSSLTAGSTQAVGVVATLTPTVWTAALTAVINALGASLVVATNPSVNEVLIRSAATVGGTVAASATATTTTETMTNAAWGAATMVDGKAAGVRKISVLVHLVTDDEATAGAVRLCFPFTVAGFMLQAYDANGLYLEGLTDQFVKATTFVTCDGTGGTNPAAGEFIHCIAWD